MIGFIASMPENILTTLKCDGNDFSTTIMGAFVLAKKDIIWTNVNGVHSVNFRKGALCYFGRLNYYWV
jgi:aspartokinase/homoserine dehydrogenase 1